MKDLNHENMPRAILFKIEVKDSYKEGGPHIHRTIEVITETLSKRLLRSASDLCLPTCPPIWFTSGCVLGTGT